MYTYEQIMSDLKKKIFKPVYFLMGDEAFYIDEITHYIEQNAITPDERPFNQTVLYGKDIDLGTMINTAKRFPMMANHNVVIIKEAQNLKGLEGVGKDDIDPFMLYVDKPLQSTILVINYRGKTLDKRKKIAKVLDTKAVLFESVKMRENQVGNWIIQHVKSKGFSIDIKAAELMAASIGNDLSKIANEIEKLIVSLPKGANITAKEIEDNVGISKEFNIFELQNALGKKDVYRANLIVTHLGQNPKTKSIIPMISFLYSFFTKLLTLHGLTDKSKQAIAVALGVNVFFAGDYLEAANNFPRNKCAYIIGFLRDYDAKAKGIDSPAVDDAELMRELIYKIMHI